MFQNFYFYTAYDSPNGLLMEQIPNSPDYKEFSQVAVFELDGEIERSAELDYIRAMSNMV